MKLSLATLAVIASVAGLTLAPRVEAITITDPQYVGMVNPGTPADPSSEVGYVTQLIAMNPGAMTSVGGNSFTRSSNTFSSLPTPTIVGSTKYDTSLPTSLDVTNWSYLILKYDGQNDGTYVFYVAGMNTTVNIPLTGPEGKGLSQILLLNPGTGVPDGGTTVLLLGIGFMILAFAKRSISA